MPLTGTYIAGAGWGEDDFNSGWLPEHKCGQATADYRGPLQSTGELPESMYSGRLFCPVLAPPKPFSFLPRMKSSVRHFAAPWGCGRPSQVLGDGYSGSILA